MQPKVQKLLFDALHAIENVELFLAEKDSAEFLDSELLQSAVERQYEVMGEALNRLRRIDPDLFESIDSAHQVVGMRNFIAHGYDIVDPRILWQTYKDNLPRLKAAINHLHE